MAIMQRDDPKMDPKRLTGFPIFDEETFSITPFLSEPAISYFAAQHAASKEPRAPLPVYAEHDLSGPLVAAW